MPKQPDLIAAEMQGDATIPGVLAEDVAEAYETSKTDGSVFTSLKRIADEGVRELSGQQLDREPGAPRDEGSEPNGAKKSLRSIFTRR